MDNNIQLSLSSASLFFLLLLLAYWSLAAADSLSSPARPSLSNWFTPRLCSCRCSSRQFLYTTTATALSSSRVVVDGEITTEKEEEEEEKSAAACRRRRRHNCAVFPRPARAFGLRSAVDISNYSRWIILVPHRPERVSLYISAKAILYVGL